MASTNGNDITIKVGMDVTSATQAVAQFEATANKGFNSTNTRVQSLSNSLYKVAQNLQKCASDMQKMKSTYVPTKDYTEAVKTMDSLEKKIKSTDSEMKKLWKNRPETAEYTQAKVIFEGLNSKVKELQTNLKQNYGKSGMTAEFRNVSAEVERLQTRFDKLNTQKLIFEKNGISSGDEYTKVETQLNMVTQSLKNAQIAQLKLQMSGKVYQDQAGYYKTVKDLKALEQQLIVADQKVKQLEADGKQFDTTAYDEAKTRLDALKQAYEEARIKKEALERTGSDRTTLANANPDALNALQNRYANLYRTGQLISNNINSIMSKTNKWSSIVSALKNSWSRLASNVKKTNTEHNNASKSVSSYAKTHNSNFKSMITMVLKYVFGIRSIFLLYKKIRTTISTGLTEMAKQFSDVADDVNTLKNSWSGFKASLVSAFQPIYSYVLPALTSLINYLTSAMNALANFFAMLTGQSYYYKAKKGNEDVAKSIGSTGSAAEEANEELAEYDDLIVIDQDSSSGGGGGGSSSGSDAWNWEKVATESVEVNEKLANIWKKFKESWEKNGKTTVEKAKTAFNNIKTLAKTVADTVYDVFMSDTGTKWLDSIYTALNGILDLIGSIAQAWIVAWNRNDAGYNFIESIFTLLTTINTIIGTITSTFARAFKSESGYSMLNSFLTLATSILTTINSIGEAFIKAWNKNDAGYNYVKSFFDMLTEISKLITTISDSFRKAWESDGTGEAIIGNIITLLTNINTIISNITSNFKTAWEEGGKGDEIMETILGIVESISTFLVDISESTKEWSANLDFNPLLESAEGLLESISGFTDTILNSLTTIYDNFVLPLAKKVAEAYLPTLLDIVSETLDTISSILSGIPLESISTALSEIADLILSLGLEALKQDMSSISDLASTLKSVADELNRSLSDLWDTVSPLLGIETTSWSDLKELLIETNTATVPLSTAVKLLNSHLTLMNNALSAVLDVLEDIKDWITDNYDTITDLGSRISGGIIGGMTGYNWIKGVTDAVFSPLTNAIKTLFGIASPAKKMYTYGEDILKGIIEGFKNAFTDIQDAIKSLYDKIVSKIKEKFSNFKLTNIISGLGDIAVNLTTTLKGAITSIAGFDSFTDVLDGIKTNYKAMKAKLSTTLEGAIQKVADLTDLDEKWGKLKDDWADKEAKLKAYVGGQMSKVSDIDTWKTSFSNLTSIWKDAKSTLSAYVGGQITDIKELTGSDGNSGWYGIFKKLKDSWNGAEAEFKTTTDTKATDEATGPEGNFTKAKKEWQSQTATFTATTDTPEELEEKVKKLADVWSKYDAEATFTINTPDENIQQAKDTIANLYDVWTSYSGTTASFNVSVNGSSKLSDAFGKLVADINASIKQAGGTTNIDAGKYTKYFTVMAKGGIITREIVLGEDGDEAVIPLERNLGWMDTMASAISDKIANVSLPEIVKGSILPATESFINRISPEKDTQVSQLLEQILDAVSSEDNRNMPTVVVQLGNKQLTQMIWDENEKKYKQAGYRYGI